jgi:hypothetical protein
VGAVRSRLGFRGLLRDFSSAVIEDRGVAGDQRRGAASTMGDRRATCGVGGVETWRKKKSSHGGVDGWNYC